MMASPGRRSRRRRPPAKFDGKRELQSAQVDSPYGTRKKDGKVALEPVLVNIRESSTATAVARKHLTEEQGRASDRFRAIYEALEGQLGQAMDLTRPTVDTSGPVDGVAERVVAAGDEMNKICGMLGFTGHAVVRRFAGEGWGVKRIAAHLSGHPQPTKATIKKYSTILRLNLDTLALHFGYIANPRDKSRLKRWNLYGGAGVRPGKTGHR